MFSELLLEHKIKSASQPLSASSQPRLGSGHPGLDELLAGGLPFGSVVEWGMPMGLGGRRVLAAFLANATRGLGTEGPLLSLWVQAAKSKLTVYPPAWAALGVELKRMRFATCGNIVRELKPLLLEPLFRVLVFDAPHSFTDDDLAFVAREARRHGQLVMLVRNYRLSPKRGTIWARLRLNCWQESLGPEGLIDAWHVSIVRGLAPRQGRFTFSKPRVEELTGLAV